MTTENVDIQVQGTVKPKIATDLRAISKAATDSYSAIERLQAMLNSLDSGGLSRVTSTMRDANSEIQKQVRALNDAAASSRMQAANLRVLQQQTEKNTAAQQASATATGTASDRLLELARVGVNAAQSQRDQTIALMESARAQQTVTTQVRENVQFTQEQIRAAQEATRAARDKIAANNALAQSEDIVTNAQQRSALGWRDYNTNLAKVGQSAQLARHHMLNLGFQLQDIGVSLASGQNPLTVAVQQGAQIQGIASQAGVSLGRLAVAVGAMLAPLLPLVAGIGALVAGLKIMNVEINQNSGLEKFSKDLGLTQKQIKKMDGDVVTMGDTFKAFFTTVSDLTGAEDMWDSFLSSATKAFKNIVGYAVSAFNSIGAFSDGVIAVMISGWEQMSPKIRNIIASMINSLINIFETGGNFIIAGINQIIVALNKVSSIKIDPFSNIVLPKVDIQGPAKDFEQAGDVFATAFKNSFETRSKDFDDFYKKWQENSLKGAKDRIKNAFDDAGGAKSSESRATAMAKINAQLDNQIQRMQMLQPIREEQQQFDAIEEQLIGKKITLNASEAASIKSKIAAIQLQKQVTQQMDRIYEEVQGSSDEYAANLEAIDLLLKKGFLSQEQYNAKLAQATEAYDQSIDPLRKYRQELQFQESTFGKNADQIELMTTKYQIEQEALKNGIALRQSDVDALMAQAAAAQYAQGVQQQYNQVYSETAGALEQVAQKQQALQMAYANGVIGQAAFNAGMVQSQIEAAKLRVAMDKALPGDEFTASMSQLMSGYQGFVAGATDSLGEMFNTMADGFSNALAGAIMGTESLGDALRNVAQQAVQQLIASLIKVGIQYAVNAALGKALGAAGVAASIGMGTATATAWAPAAAMVSLATLGANAVPANAAILSTSAVSMGAAMAGFQSGGYTGNGAVDQIAGMVHGQEYVMNADTVSRIGVSALDAIQSGTPLSAFSMGGGASNTQMVQSTNNVGNGSVTVTVINNADGTTATTSQTENDQGGKDITVTIDSIENALASRVSSGQGPMSNAIQTSLGVQHKPTVR